MHRQVLVAEGWRRIRRWGRRGQEEHKLQMATYHRSPTNENPGIYVAILNVGYWTFTTCSIFTACPKNVDEWRLMLGHFQKMTAKWPTKDRFELKLFYFYVVAFTVEKQR